MCVQPKLEQLRKFELVYSCKRMNNCSYLMLSIYIQASAEIITSFFSKNLTKVQIKFAVTRSGFRKTNLIKRNLSLRRFTQNSFEARRQGEAKRHGNTSLVGDNLKNKVQTATISLIHSIALKATRLSHLLLHD